MNLEVIYNGKPALKLNRILVSRQNLTEEQVEQIKMLHVRRLTIEDAMKTAVASYLKSLADQWSENQYLLQDAWGFPRNANFHKFWEASNRCLCPTFDNEERVGLDVGFFVNESCPLHGT